MSSTLPILAPNELRNQPAANWLWHGYLATGNTTLLASQWKAGKTTLLSALLGKMRTGGELAGLTVKPARAVVLSEEDPSLWQPRHKMYNFGDNLGLLCRPFRGKPTHQQWAELMEQLTERQAVVGLDLLVIDTMITFLPGRNENNANLMAEALLPLQQLTSQGVAVLILHHTRKQESADGKMARGSGALAGFVDILIEKHWYGSPEGEDRRRRLQSWSRYSETTRQLIVEWMANGEYVARGDVYEEIFRSHWDLLHAVLAVAQGKLTREQIRRRWPEGHEPPEPITLWRWLSRAVEQGQVERSGAGHGHDPHRYWLKEKEPEFQQRKSALLDLPPLEELW
jgi:RecA-family ATPase